MIRQGTPVATRAIAAEPVAIEVESPGTMTYFVVIATCDAFVAQGGATAGANDDSIAVPRGVPLRLSGRGNAISIAAVSGEGFATIARVTP